MKKGFLKITALCMVAILMLSSFTLEKHFCGESLKDVAFNSETKSCCVAEVKDVDNIVSINKKDCCKTESEFNTTSFFELKNNLKLSQKDVVFITSFFKSYMLLYVSPTTKSTYFNQDFSPKLIFNKQVRFQSFLI